MNTDVEWSTFNVSHFQQHDGTTWKLKYLSHYVKYQTDTNIMEIKMSRDFKHNQMLSGAVYKSADMHQEGTYEVFCIFYFELLNN